MSFEIFNATEPVETLTQLEPRGGWGAKLEAATREVFEIMLNIPLRSVSNAEPPLVADLTVMVGISGKLRGVLSLHCAADSACLWASRMLGMELREFDQNVRDGIGEMCNMVAGHFKSSLDNHLGDKCMISTPTVISGTDYQLHSLSGGEHVEVALGFEGAPLWITLDLRN
jgi:chemotaxis protein CheX